MSKLPASYEASLEDDWPEEPEWEDLGWGFVRRGRGALMAAAIVGTALFFAPWVHVTAPEIVTLTGFELARTLGWIWGCLVSWLMLLATVVSRRSVAKMRGARVAAALFSALPLVTMVVLLLTPPTSSLVPIRFEYAWPFYATGALGAVALGFALRFGGSMRDLPSRQGSSRGQTLH